MQEYVVVFLLGMAMLFLCVSSYVGRNLQHRRSMQARETGYTDDSLREGEANSARAAAGPLQQPPLPTDGHYYQMYYHQHHSQGGSGHIDGDSHRLVGSSVHSAGVNSPGATQQAIPATVLLSAPAGMQVGDVNYTHYFPEAQVVGSNGPGNNVDCSEAAANEEATSCAEMTSPYGEADYVPQVTGTPLQSKPPPP
ncbi:hypothetical protein JKF63_03918 [Porcisia hertigi]|uniref:Uncharacterized protein n=1 Tax=Porcisia hertigi TaxID=2761500 RepID=A0A836ILZ8_9TRYP|nr:hypothetical protein JKF63_03918 [Porcisia hertigi]